MIDSKLKKPGKLVKFRGRRCVVQPSSDNEIVLLKPLGGSDDEMISVFEPVLQAFDKLEDDDNDDDDDVFGVVGSWAHSGVGVSVGGVSSTVDSSTRIRIG